MVLKHSLVFTMELHGCLHLVQPLISTSTKTSLAYINTEEQSEHGQTVLSSVQGQQYRSVHVAWHVCSCIFNSIYIVLVVSFSTQTQFPVLVQLIVINGNYFLGKNTVAALTLDTFVSRVSKLSTSNKQKQKNWVINQATTTTTTKNRGGGGKKKTTQQGIKIEGCIHKVYLMDRQCNAGLAYIHVYVFICHNNQHIDCGHHRKDKTRQDKKIFFCSLR